MREVFYFCFFCLFFGCSKPTPSENPIDQIMTANPKFFGTTSAGDSVFQYTMSNGQGMEVSFISYGGIITNLKVADRQGNLEDVVLGFDDLNSYEEGSPYFGALIGRYGNRIAKGKFSLDGQSYNLAVNNIGNHLHGGLQGFDKVNWRVEPVSENSFLLQYHSKHMEEGYPGNLAVKVRYTLDENNSLRIDYEATTDQPTVVNLTQHSYFNLNPSAPDVLGHELTINADQYLAVDETLIPLDSIANVEGTPFDFRTPTLIGARIDQDHQQIKRGGGYDHCWVLDSMKSLRSVASVYEEQTGRKMEVLTTEPGIQFYSGNFLDGSITGKQSTVYQRRSGFCLETQHFPDSPNRPDFPSVRLDPDQIYSSSTVYRFSVQ